MIYAYLRVSTTSQKLDRQERNIRIYCQNKGYDTPIFFSEKYTGGKVEGREQLEKLKKVAKNEGDIIIFDSVSRLSRNAEEGMDLYKTWYDKKVQLEFINEPMCNTEFYREQIAMYEKADVQVTTGNKPIDKFANNTFHNLQELFIDLALQQIKVCFEQSQKELEDIQSRVKAGLKAKVEKERQTNPTYHLGGKEGVSLTTKKSIVTKKLIEYFNKDFNGDKNDFDTLNSINNLTDKMVESLSKKLSIEIPKGFHVSRNSFYKYKREIKESTQD